MTGSLRSVLVRFALAIALCAAIAGGLSARHPVDAPLAVTAVDSVGFTVSDMERALAFYTEVLPFQKLEDVEVAGRAYELLTGVFGARSRVVRLKLGSETIELTEFLSPKGRPVPIDVRANDRLFQHIAIVVSDVNAAYQYLRRHRIEHGSAGPQTLPDWNPSAGGIEAFYFRDPDRHFLEIISFPPGKGAPQWQSRGQLFLGIDHTAIVVDDTDASLGLYRDALGLRIAGESENHGAEQEHLNNVFGARLRITALRAERGPGIELLEYLAPRDGRPAPTDLRANDLAHWQTTLTTDKLDAVLRLAREHRIGLVSPGPVNAAPGTLSFAAGALARDADGHGLRFVRR
jgi:catechol 2,3-dioxygenase-like lactoylglutathione lyase family enzyme